MNGASITPGYALREVPASWTLVNAHGDYNGDGQSDILWRTDTGALTLWEMDAGHIGVTKEFGAVPFDWSVTDAVELTGVIIGSNSNAADTLVGSVGRDTLNGRGGNDTLTGGAGGDRFAMTSAPNTVGNNDTITDFEPGSDKLTLSDVIFTSLPGGALAAGSFVSGASPVAADANDYILYNSVTGAVSYDADGSGSASAVVFATLANHAALTAHDVYVGLI
jgi:Ca2+-binding RTX toxin-like protein